MEKLISFDFDGVVHSYTSGWAGDAVILDGPVPGIREAIVEIRSAGYKVVVHSYRCRTKTGRDAIREWLRKHGILVDDVVAEKPLAVVHIDDRAICFDGKPATLFGKIKNFSPWYQQKHLPWDLI